MSKSVDEIKKEIKESKQGPHRKDLIRQLKNVKRKERRGLKK